MNQMGALMIRRNFVFAVLMVAAVLTSTNSANARVSKKNVEVSKQASATTIAGQPVEIYTIQNAHGVEVRAMNFGGIILSLLVPDKKGKLDDVVLGFDNLEEYSENPPHFGGIIGRYANRIANGEFTLDGKKYTLAKNNGPNTLHGGLRGFDKVFWQVRPFENRHGAGILLTYTSKDGEEGFPGNLKTRVKYTLTDNDELIFDYEATTDNATPVNLTQHTYFNLAGEGTGDILGHELMLGAREFTPVDKNLIPTGELRAVAGTPLDFTKPTTIGARINDKYEQMVLGNGYDHNFVITNSNSDRNGKGLTFAARVREPKSG